MNTTSPHMDRLLELSVDDALHEMSPEDAAEYARLRETYPDFDPAATDRAVGATLAALLGVGETPPDRLQARLERDMTAHFRAGSSAPVELAPVAARRSQRFTLPSWAPWLAAAASLLLAFGLWWQGAPQTSQPSPSQARAALLESGHAVVLQWSGGGDRTGAQTTGDVVWDAEHQVGYMRFVGLAHNDPTREQYQLWIFDRQRDERYPVDGGVFDISADGEVVVPIRATLPVSDSTLFAVTVEKPGGVVVSDRSRIAVLAKRG
jgi:hypothetical protein